MTEQFRSTEEGIRLLRATLRSYRRLARIPPIVVGRVRHTSLGTSHPTSLSVQGGFLRLVSIAEATVDAIAAEATSRQVTGESESLVLLVLEKELALTSTWEARRRGFKRHHGVNLRQCDERKKVEAAVEVRNAIAHGLGRLTTRQRQSAETSPLLRLIDVDTPNGELVLEPRHLDDCVAYSTTFLRSVDERVAAN